MTKQEREEAVELESQLAVKQFINRSQLRDWSPNDLPVDEMSAYGHLLTPATVTIAEAFMGVEAQLPYYLDAGDLLIGDKYLKDIPSEAMFGDRWGFEEGRHRPAFGRILVASGVRTESQVAEYNAQVLQHGWSPKDHPGLDSLVGIRIYRMFQERGAYVNDRGLLHLVRQDYGLPQNLTDEERKRGHQIGAAEAVDKVSKDELGHHVINLELVRIHLKYFRDETLEKLREIREGFRMPALNLLPNKHEFVRALRSTHIYNGRVYQQQVVQPTLKSLGLKVYGLPD